jgi:hypothetical protein
VDLPFLLYIASVLASLPYVSKEEVMTLLEHLTRTINIQGESLEQELTGESAARLCQLNLLCTPS